MSLFHNASATIDEQMLLRKADESFYKFLGQNIYGSVVHCICPEDLPKFENAFNELKSKKVARNFVTLRIKNHSEEYDWFLVKLTYEPFELNGTPLIRLDFSSLSEHFELSNELQKANDEYETLLSLSGTTMLSYDSASGLLTIFTNCDGQKIYLFQGQLEDWKKYLLSEKLNSDYDVELHALCLNMETGKKTFKHTLLTNCFSKDGSMKLCTFKCQSIADSNTSHKTLGCITMLGEGEAADLDIGYSMDTGLPVLNKKSITEYAKKAMLSNDGKVHLIILDLDDFKTINDTYGHMFGDEVLIQTSEIIKNAIGNAGIAGRIGGDEMLIVLTKIESHAELRNMLRTIRTNIEWSYKEKQSDLHITCSMGVAVYPDHGDTYDQIFQLADKMLYIAKSKGKNRYVIYTPEIHDLPADFSRKSDENNNLELLRNDRAGVMQRLIEKFLIRKIVTYESALKEIGFCLELDEIVMIYDNMKVSSTWNHSGFLTGCDGGEYFHPEESFLNSFDENNVYVVNGLFNLEGKSPSLYKLLTEHYLESVLFYKMVNHGDMFGYIMFAKKNRRQMWSEYDKTFLASVGKILELSFMER